MALPGLIDTLLQSCQLEGSFFIVFDAETKALDTEIFPQHTISDLNSGISIYCFVQPGDAFTVNRNKHLRTHTHTHTHTQIHTYTHSLVGTWVYH